MLSEQFETPRLRLRVPVPGDAPTIFNAYAQDPAVCRFMVWSLHVSVAVTEAFIAESIELWSAGTPLRYVLARSRWGSGLMPEAIGVLASACFAQPQVFRVQAICDVENRASARALEKSGFRREGRLARYGIHPNISPEPRDVFMYARVR